MTREEAIKYIDGLHVVPCEQLEEFCAERNTAIDMAIEALQRQTDGDLISRADAIDAVAEEWLSEASAESPYVNDNDIDRYRELAEELFADIPSADAEQVTGKLKKPCDSLLTEESNGSKEHKSKLESADAVSRYAEWLEKIIVDNEGANEWLCEDTPDLGWCEDRCHYSSIQVECLRHLYEVSKGGDDE